MSNIIEAFNDIDSIPLLPTTGMVAGQSQLNNVRTLQIGNGVQAFHGDQSGIWLGAERFVDAPFSVDMLGNVIASSGTFGQYLTKAGTAQAFSGSINVGVGNVKIDGANKRILINDGTNDRILIGFQSAGF